jgi:hypothetical protein
MMPDAQDLSVSSDHRPDKRVRLHTTLPSERKACSKVETALLKRGVLGSHIQSIDGW